MVINGSFESPTPLPFQSHLIITCCWWITFYMGKLWTMIQSYLNSEISRSLCRFQKSIKKTGFCLEFREEVDYFYKWRINHTPRTNFISKFHNLSAVKRLIFKYSALYNTTFSKFQTKSRHFKRFLKYTKRSWDLTSRVLNRADFVLVWKRSRHGIGKLVQPIT
jgi:hypothetical protein